MKKIVSSIALFSILFSSIGTSISAYADTVSISAPTNSGDGLANIEHRTDPLLDRINGQGLSGGELALHYIHNKITLSGKKYIIAQNATASEKAILLQEIPEYDGSNRNEIDNLKDLKLKTIEDIFNRPITGAQLSHLSNPFTPHIQIIEMGLTGRELAGIWQTKLTREGFDYLLEHNASTREKSLARELRSFTNQRDNAETDGNQAVLGLGSGDGFQLLMRLISRGVTKTQLQYLVDNNMLDYVISEDDEGLVISAPTQDPNVSKIESPEEREARLKREKKAREEEAAKVKEEARQKNQEQQEKLGGLFESSLFELLSERKVTNDGLEFLITLRGNLTKSEINLILKESVIKKAISKQRINLRTQLKSKLDTIYNLIFQKLAKGGLTKEQNNNFAKFIKIEEEKNIIPIGTNNEGENNEEENTGDRYQYSEYNEVEGVQNPSFFAKRNDISRTGNGAYQVNFKGITENGYGDTLKAGKVQAIFKGKTNFPKKLILPEGFTYEVKSDSLNAEFIKTNALKQRIENLGVDVGQIHIKKPELRILPDRIEYVKKTTLVFDTEAQLQNIKDNLSEQFGNENINSMINNLKNVKLETVKQLQSGTAISQVNNLNLQPVNHDLFGLKKAMPDLSLANMNNGYNSSLYSKAPGENKINANILSNLNNLSDAQMTDIIEEECNNNSSLTTAQKQNCSNAENFEKILETEEVIGYSLIPTTLEDLRNNKKSLIALDSKDIRLTKANIMKRFTDLKEINQSKDLVGDDYRNINSTGSVAPVDVFANPNFCNIKYGTGTIESTNCQTAKDKMMEVTPKTFSQDLLNGFTIGETKNYSWGTSASVYIPFVGSIKVFKIKFGFSYGYAFGIRIPIHVEGGISDNKVYAYADENVNKGNYDTWIKANTLDGDEEYYKKVLDDANDYHAYKGKEFVFEFTASASIDIWIKGLGGARVDIPLVSSLIVGLVAATTVANGGDADDAITQVGQMFGVQNANIFPMATSLIIDGMQAWYDNVTKGVGEGAGLGITGDDLNFTLNQFNFFFDTLTPLLVTYIDAKSQEGAFNKEEFNRAKNHVKQVFNDSFKVDSEGNIVGLKEGFSIDDFRGASDDLDNVLDGITKMANTLSEDLNGEIHSYLTDTQIRMIEGTATVLQSDILMHFIKNNGIDLSKNFKPPFGDETIPLYRLESPEIPLYMDGLLKLVAKLGVKSELGGRITTKCSEVNSEGACPENTDSAGEFGSDETAITYNYDNTRLHINNNNKYLGSGYAVDGADDSMGEDDLGKFSNFGIKFSDFRYHPELIFILFAKAGAGVHIPYIGWATYWTPDIDLYTFKFSSDDLYLGQHEGTVGVFDMTKTASGELNKVYTVQPPIMENIDSINYGDDNGEKYLLVYPKFNTIGGNHVYYTKKAKVINLNRRYRGINLNIAPTPECGEINNTKLYVEKESNIWPTYKTDLKNNLTVDVKAIACNNLYETKSDIKASSLSLLNTYHRPFYILEDQNSSPRGFNKVTSGTTLDIDKNEGLYLTMNSKSLEGEINKSDVTHEYIKYKISDEDNINLNCSNGTLYNGEKIMFSQSAQGEIENGIISIGSAQPVTEFGPGSTKYLDIVKCATRDDGSIFESIHNKITVMAWSSAANNAFKDKAHGAAQLAQIKAILEALGDFRADLLGGSDKVGGGMNPLDFYAANGGYNKMSLSLKMNTKTALNIGIDGNLFNGAETGATKTQITTFNHTGGPNPYDGNEGKDKGHFVPGLKPVNNLGNYNYGKDLKPSDNLIYGTPIPTKPVTSTDEYVNEKLDEINDCFKSTYESHNSNIEKTISNFEKTKNSSNKQSTKDKYEKAINKLEEIKELFLKRYKFILDYEKGNFGEVIIEDTGSDESNDNGDDSGNSISNNGSSKLSNCNISCAGAAYMSGNSNDCREACMASDGNGSNFNYNTNGGSFGGMYKGIDSLQCEDKCGSKKNTCYTTCMTNKGY